MTNDQLGVSCRNEVKCEGRHTLNKTLSLSLSERFAPETSKQKKKEKLELIPTYLI
jgi:hypothetical protein